MRDDLVDYLRTSCGSKGAAAADRVGAGFTLLRRAREHQHQQIQQQEQQLTRHHSAGRRSFTAYPTTPAIAPVSSSPAYSSPSGAIANGAGVGFGVGGCNGSSSALSNGHVALVAARLKEQQTAVIGRPGGYCGNRFASPDPHVQSRTVWSEQYHTNGTCHNS